MTCTAPFSTGPSAEASLCSSTWRPSSPTSAERPTTEELFARVACPSRRQDRPRPCRLRPRRRTPRLVIVADASIVANASRRRPRRSLARTRLTTAGQLAAPDPSTFRTGGDCFAGDGSPATSLTVASRPRSIDLEDLDLFVRYPTLHLMRRAFELRANVTVYDAAYVMLAEPCFAPPCSPPTNDSAQRRHRLHVSRFTPLTDGTNIGRRLQRKEVS